MLKIGGIITAGIILFVLCFFVFGTKLPVAIGLGIINALICATLMYNLK